MKTGTFPQRHVKTQGQVTPLKQLLSPPGSLPLALPHCFAEVCPCGRTNAPSPKSCHSHGDAGRVEGRAEERSRSSALLAAVKGELTNTHSQQQGNDCSCSGSANPASVLQPWHWSFRLPRDVEARRFGCFRASWLLGIMTHCYSNRSSHDYCLLKRAPICGILCRQTIHYLYLSTICTLTSLMNDDTLTRSMK